MIIVVTLRDGANGNEAGHGGRGVLDFNEVVDFRAGYEVALLKAQVDFKQNEEEIFHLKISRGPPAIDYNFIIRAHAMRTAADFVQLATTMDIASSRPTDELYPSLSDFLSVSQVGRDGARLALNTRAFVSLEVERSTPFTRRVVEFTEGTGVLNLVTRPSIDIDLSGLRDGLSCLDVCLDGFVVDENDQLGRLTTIPLTEGNTIGGRIEYEAPLPVYKPVTKDFVSIIRLECRLNCQPGHVRPGPKVKRGSCVLHLRPTGQS